MPGQIFGRYELIRLVGSGGMAQVHLARQRGPEGFVKPCVLKRIAAPHAGTETIRAMFLEEARISALLNHPNIVQTFDFGEVSGVPYMAMELVDGVNLAQLCRTLAQHDRWLPLQPAVEIVAAVLDALDYAHNLTDLNGNPLHLVHRDVSPQNTLLSRPGTVKLSDFGIARHDARQLQTVGVQAKGKPGYMAPEQAMSGHVDARADLFAVGIMLAELISARRVLTSKDRLNHILDIENRVRTLCALRTESPPELNELAVRLCALEPDRRPPSAREAVGLLRRVAARVPPSTGLQDFLRSVFDAYLQDAGTASLPPVPKATEHPTQIVEGLSAPPESSASDLRFERGAWDQSGAQPTGVEAVYEQGWPKGYLPEDTHPAASDLPLPDPAPPAAAPDSKDIEVVQHSSSVDAMQYFQAQMSEDLAHERPSEDEVAKREAARDRARRVPYVVGAREAPPEREETSSLPKPVFDESDGAATSATTKGMLGFDDPALKKALASIDDEGAAKEEKKPFKLPPVVPLLGAGLVVVVAAFGVLSMVSGGEDDKQEAEPMVGSVEVTSDPPGGKIFLEGRDTGETTPATLEGLALEKPMRLSVKREGHRSVPPDVVVRIPQISLRTTAQFILQPGRAYRLVTDPPEATVTVNGHRLTEVTPVTLPVVPFGTNATIALSLDGHMPHKMLLESRTTTPTIAEVTLEPGKSIEISSNPPGARVFLDGEPIGQTPIYDVLVPVERRFGLRIEHRGYRRWKKRLRGKALDPTQPLVADLEPLPFLALPWSRAEKKQARDVDRAHSKLARKISGLEQQLKRAQQRQRVVESSINASVGDLAEVQRRTDLLREAVVNAEQELADLESRMDRMREQLLLRMEDE